MLNYTGKTIASKRSDLQASIFLIVFSLVLSNYIMEGWSIDLRIPFIYFSDGLWTSASIKGFTENAWYFSNSNIGYPFGSNSYDFPGADFGNNVILKLLAVIVPNYSVVLNLYFLLGFPVTALVSYFVMRSFSVSRLLALAGSIIFTFIPFHFLRLGHLTYTWYFVIPLFVWYSLRISSVSPLFLGKSESRWFKISSAFGLLILSSFGVYYAFFGVLMLLSAGCIASLKWRAKSNVFSALLAAAIVTTGVAANVIPNVLYKIKNGPNSEVAMRAPSHSEILGLKITQLLLPRPGHRSEKLAEITRNYSTSFPLINENSFASLGMVGSLGFLLLLGVILTNRPGNPSTRSSLVLHQLAPITLVLVLFATVGGFASFFSMLITPDIRAWNRISIFIGFASISGAILFLNDQLDKHRSYRHIIPLEFLIVASLILFAIWDQTTSACLGCRKGVEAEFNNDARFVRKIESILPKGGAVYQLPYFPFPETPPINGLAEYGLFRGYLHSSTLKWSYGAMKGRRGDLFFRELSQQSLGKQLEVIGRLNFSGVYIDRRGYVDHASRLEADLASLLGGALPIVSDDNHLSFFAMPAQGAEQKMPVGLSIPQMMEHANFVVERCSLPSCLRFSVSEGINYPHQVGVIKNGRISTTGSSGYIVFGPQVKMVAGTYVLQVFGAATNIVGMSVDIIDDLGAMTIAMFNKVEPPTNKEILLEKVIHLDKQSNKLEVRVFADKNSIFDIAGYKFKRIGD